MKKILIGSVGIGVIIVLVGIYNFNYLANQGGYGIDGNRIKAIDCASNGSDCKKFNSNKVNKLVLTQNLISVSPQEFKAFAETGEYTIIDIRTPEELLPENGGKIFPEAINIDFYEPDFAKNLMKLDRDEKYLIYCRSGSRSRKTLSIMKKAGFFNVINLKKGKVAWDKTYQSIVGKSEEPKMIICTADAKICPDGSAVGRTGSNCEFAKCPSIGETSTVRLNIIETNKEVGSVEGGVGGISLNEVAEHNEKTDCWGVINGKVYDVTAFFEIHPGGDQNLFRICGIDATRVFQAKHAGDSKPNVKLKDFYIGDLSL